MKSYRLHLEMSLEKLHTFDLLIFSDNVHNIYNLFIDNKMIRPFNEAKYVSNWGVRVQCTHFLNDFLKNAVPSPSFSL